MVVFTWGFSLHLYIEGRNVSHGAMMTHHQFRFKTRAACNVRRARRKPNGRSLGNANNPTDSGKEGERGIAVWVKREGRQTILSFSGAKLDRRLPQSLQC